MPRDLNRAQVALLLSIDEATWPRGQTGAGLSLRSSVDRTRLMVDGLIMCSRRGNSWRWVTTALGKARAMGERADQAERRADAP